VTNIPAGIFDNNSACTTYSNCFYLCAATQASVDNFLVSLDSHGTSNGSAAINSGSSSAPGTAGATAKSNLQSRGWTVSTN